MKKIILASLMLITITFYGQDDKVYQTFGTSRIINSHSTESVKKGTLDFRISHRFGDINGGIYTMAGIDNAADIRIAGEYGISDNLMIGIGRSKGPGPIISLLDGFVKYRILHQTKDNKIPLSISVLGTCAITYMKKSNDSTSVASFPTFSHRIAYATQLIFAKKFGERFSLAILPTYTHRNYVHYQDQNDLFSIGSALSLKVSKKVAIIGEYYYNFNNSGIRDKFENSVGIGFEYVTNGHNFHLNLTNSRGFGETQFIPYTVSKIEKGEFRIGFTITRNFKF